MVGSITSRARFPARLADLSDGRRVRLLMLTTEKWGHVLASTERANVSDICDLWSSQKCEPPVGARLADDGLFHLLGDGAYDCAKDAQAGGKFRHHYDQCYWERWQVQPRIAPPTERERDHGGWVRTLTWLDQTWTDVSAVRSRDRCPLAAQHWPGYTGSAERDRQAQTRRWLVRKFGPMCNCCGLRRACQIDHDHATGLVRGYVCRHCNSRLDGCLHLSGCPWADYQNDPPALLMRLPYHGRTRQISPPAASVLREREVVADAALANLAALHSGGKRDRGAPKS